MSSTGKNIRFSAAVWGTCCGTAVFKQLIFHSWGRVIAHFLLLIFLLSVIITASVFKRAWNETGRMTDVFTAEFGNLTLGPQGMRPSLLPEKARTVAMPGDGRLIYLPDNGNANYSPDDLNVFDYLIIWMPKKQLIAVNHSDDLGWVLLSNSGTASEKNFVANTAELSVFLKEQSPESDFPWEKMPFLSKPFTFWANFFLMGLAITNFFGYFIGMAWTTLLYIGIFALMFRLTGGMKRLLSMTGSQFCKIGVYAAFPALLVAACFPVLNLKLLSFNTVYMIGLVMYWLIIVNRNEMDFRQNQGGIQ